MAEELNAIVDAFKPITDSEYLAFIAKRAPDSLRDDLFADGWCGGPDVREITVDEFIRPLRDRRFPDNASLWEMDWISSELIGGYALESYAHNAFKVIYVCSLAIHCNAKLAKVPNCDLSQVCQLLAEVSRTCDVTTRMAVVRFLLQRVPTLSAHGPRGENPRVLYAGLLACLWATNLREIGNFLAAADHQSDPAHWQHHPEPTQRHATAQDAERWNALIDAVFDETGDVAICADQVRRLFQMPLWPT